MTSANQSTPGTLDASWTPPPWGKGVAPQKGPWAPQERFHLHLFRLLCAFQLLIFIANNATQSHSRGLHRATRTREPNGKE